MSAFWNRIINALSLMALMMMASTGFLLKWVLPPGGGRARSVGTGGRGRAVYTVLGLDRHDWGSIHFYISLGFLFLLGVHLILHWKWICATAWGTSANPQPFGRKVLTMGIILFIMAVLLFPWILRKETYP